MRSVCSGSNAGSGSTHADRCTHNPANDDANTGAYRHSSSYLDAGADCGSHGHADHDADPGTYRNPSSDINTDAYSYAGAYGNSIADRDARA